MMTEQKNRSGLLLFLILILIIRITSYFMLSESVAVTQGIKITMRMITVGLSAFLLAVCYRKNSSGLAAYENKMPLLFYLLYLFLGTCSLFWTSSFNDSALQLLMDFECLAFSFLFINVLFLLNAPPYKEIRLSKILSVSILIIAGSFIAGMNVLPEIFYRQTHGGEVSRLGGFIINPNELGMLLVIGIAMLFVEMTYAGKKWLPVLLTTVPLYALWMTGSRSSMIGLLFILAYFVWKSKSVKLRIAVAAIVVLIIPIVFEKVFIKAGNMNEVLSLTGRIPFWKDLLTTNFPKEPVLGYGFMRIDYEDKFISLNSYAGAMTHNTFIQVLMNLGLTGLFIVLIQLTTTIIAIHSEKNTAKKSLGIGLLIPALVNSFTEFGIYGEANYSIMFYLFVVLMFSSSTVQPKEKPKTREVMLSEVEVA